LFRVGQVAFSGRYCLRCGFKLFSLYSFADGETLTACSRIWWSEYQKA
jgi:hypothetical protein